MPRSPCYDCILKDLKKSQKEDLCEVCPMRILYYESIKEQDSLFEAYQKSIGREGKT